MSLDTAHAPREAPEKLDTREQLAALKEEVLQKNERATQSPAQFAALLKASPGAWVDQIPSQEEGRFTIKLPYGNNGPFYLHSRVDHFIGPNGGIVQTSNPESFTVHSAGRDYHWQNGADGMNWRDETGKRLLVGDGTDIQFFKKPQTRPSTSETETKETATSEYLRFSTHLESNNGRPVTLFAHPETAQRANQKLVVILPGHNLIGNGQVDNALAQGLGQTLLHPKPGVIYAFVDGPPTVAEHQNWMRTPGSFTRFMDEIQHETIHNGFNPTQVELIGHSGAGGVLASAARHEELHADHVTLADASYGSWAAEIAQSGVPMEVNAIQGSPTSPGAAAVSGLDNTTLHWTPQEPGKDSFQLHMNSLSEAVARS